MRRRIRVPARVAAAAGVLALPATFATAVVLSGTAAHADTTVTSPSAAPVSPTPTAGSGTDQKPKPTPSSTGPCLPALCPTPTPTATRTATAAPTATRTATAAPVATATSGSGGSTSSGWSSGSRSSVTTSSAGSQQAATTSHGFPDGVWTLVPGGAGKAPAARPGDAPTTAPDTQQAAGTSRARDPVTTALGLAVLTGVVLGAVGAAGLWATRHRVAAAAAPAAYAPRHAGPR